MFEVFLVMDIWSHLCSFLVGVLFFGCCCLMLVFDKYGNSEVPEFQSSIVVEGSVVESSSTGSPESHKRMVMVERERLRGSAPRGRGMEVGLKEGLMQENCS